MVDLFSRYLNWSVHEIYPESETPHLTQIAHLDGLVLDTPNDPPAYLLPVTVIWFDFRENSIVFIVWDYRLNHSTSFSVDVDVKKFEFDLEVYFISKALKLAFNSFVGR